MNKLFLSLDDAVKVAVRHFDLDEEIARQEFEQKCYVSDDQYKIGFYDGVNASLKAVKTILTIE